MKRIFSVRLNLDDMAASLEFLEGDAALAEWLRGFRYGLRGAASRWQDGPGADGFRIGASSLAEAQGFQLAKSDGGKKSAKVRKEKTGTAQPSKDTSKIPRTHIEDSSVKNGNSSNQSLIVNPLSLNSNRESVNEQERARLAELDICTPTKLDPKPPSDADHWQMHEKHQAWARALIAASCKIGRDNWTAWKALVDHYSLNSALSAAKGVLATERWPDRVESTLTASRGQANPGDVVKTIKLKL